jgi:thiol-disulfide isomerase/thioredoxin
MTRLALAAALVLTLATVARADDPLSVGDPAPKLEVKEFVKGQPVKKLDKGKVYVVEFWATWCGPCKESIPHLTKLAKEHKNVTFIGVSVWEQDQDDVKPFVKEMGDKMDYRVAIDLVEGAADKGAMAKSWMAAAEQDGIPTAFIINKEGKVAWIGHPMEMDKPLAEIVAGKWDLKAQTVAYKAERAREKKVQALANRLERGMKSGDLKAALTAADALVKEDPKAKEMVAQQLNEAAWDVVNPDKVQENKPAAKQLKAAVTAATKAVELSGGEDANILDTLAQAHFLNGDVAKAIEVQEKAIKLNPDDKELKNHLEAFKKAKDQKKDKDKDGN